MKRPYLPILLSVLSLITVAPSGGAEAASEALIALRDSGTEGWRRQGQAQELLRERYGFDTVHVVVNATPDEIPARVRAFVERPGDARTHRLVWISGAASGDPTSPCPSPDAQAMKPGAATLILAPRCFAEKIVLAPGSRHFEITSPVPTRRPRFERPYTPALLAVLTLPSDVSPFVDQADDIVLNLLGQGGEISAARLLVVLRHDLDTDGSDYTPVLKATKGLATRIVLVPGGIAAVADTAANWAGHSVRARFLAFDLRRVPDPTTDPALRLPGATPLRALRRDRGGRMVFVNAANRFYGWVAADDLE
jgi:hypothetical protein